MKTYKIKKDLGGDETVVEISEEITETSVENVSIKKLKEYHAIALADIAHLESALSEAKQRANDIVAKLKTIDSKLGLGIKNIPTTLTVNK